MHCLLLAVEIQLHQLLGGHFIVCATDIPHRRSQNSWQVYANTLRPCNPAEIFTQSYYP